MIRPAQQVLHQLAEMAYAPVYHGTYYYQLGEILRTDILSARHGSSDVRPFVSLSRSLRVAQGFGPAVLVLDQEKLRSRYRIVPVDYWATRSGPGKRPWTGQAPKMARSHQTKVSAVTGSPEQNYEAEERVYSDITPLRPYLVSILVDENKVKRWAGMYPVQGSGRESVAGPILSDPLLNKPFPKL